MLHRSCFAAPRWAWSGATSTRVRDLENLARRALNPCQGRSPDDRAQRRRRPGRRRRCCGLCGDLSPAGSLTTLHGWWLPVSRPARRLRRMPCACFSVTPSHGRVPSHRRRPRPLPHRRRPRGHRRHLPLHPRLGPRPLRRLPPRLQLPATPGPRRLRRRQSRRSPWTQDVYARARARGLNHAHAVRVLARAWLR